MHDGLTQGHLKSIIEYRPDTGVFYWIDPPKYHPRMMGKEAGCIVKSRGPKQYLKIRIGGTPYFAARLAWLYMRGSFPYPMVDHIDGDSLNNKWDNLREVTALQNAQNRKGTRKKTDLPMGIREMPSGSFQARLRVNKTTIYLGTYATTQEAEKIYIEAREKYFGQYA